MSRIAETRRRIEAALRSIEDLDRDLEAERLAADEHGRRRAVQE